MKKIHDLIFISLFGGVFILALRRNKEIKGFKKVRVSFKQALASAALMAQLEVSVLNNNETNQNVNFEATRSSVNKVVSNQLLTDQKSKISFSQEEMEYLGLNDSKKTILVKGVDAFPVTPTYPARQGLGRRSGVAGGPIGTRPTPSTSKLSRIPNRYSRMPQNQGLYGGATGVGGAPGPDGGSGNGNDSDESDLRVGVDRSDQSPNPHQHAHLAKSKKLKNGVVEISYDKNGNPIFTYTGNDGRKAVFTYDQALAKYYHADLYGLAFPQGFDKSYALGLKPNERKAYIASTVPREKILEFQKANVTSFISDSLQPVPGFIGARKNPGTIYINKKNRQIHFVDEGTNQWRTTVIQSKAQLTALANNGFHLFPNAK